MNGSYNPGGQRYQRCAGGNLIQYLYIFAIIVIRHDLHDKEGDVSGDLFLAHMLDEPREIHRQPLVALGSCAG